LKYGFEGFSKAMGQIASETIKIIVAATSSLGREVPLKGMTLLDWFVCSVRTIC